MQNTIWLLKYRRSPHIVIFGSKEKSWNEGIMNSEDCFYCKTSIWVQKISKVQLLSLFFMILNFFSLFKYRFQVNMLIDFFVIIISTKEILIFIWQQSLYINKKLWIRFFSSKSWNGEEFTKLRPERESRNSGDHELWNHEMRESPVYALLIMNRL